MLPYFLEWRYRKGLSLFCNWVTLFGRFDLEVCKWLNSQNPFLGKFSPICVKHVIFSDICRNLMLLGVKKCMLTQYNSRRCLILANFSTEYELSGEVADMKMSELHQYFNEVSWLFIENYGSGSKTEYWFSTKPGINNISKINIISCADVFMWHH